MTEERKRRGRPTKEPGSEGRVSLGLRVTPDVKRRLDAAAALSGRSQSQEAEMRLERSFQEDAGAGGHRVRLMLNLVTSSFARAGQYAADASARTFDEPDKWVNDPACYGSAALAAVDTIIKNMPGATDEDQALFIEALKGRLLTRIANRSTEGEGNG